MSLSFSDLLKDNISMYTIPVIWVGPLPNVIVASRANTSRFGSIIPRFWAGFYYGSKTQGKGMMDVRAPRTWHAQIEADSRLDAQTKGRLQRAEAAVANNIEQLCPYAAAIVAGTVAGLTPVVLNGTALGFLTIRIIYNIAYVLNDTRNKASVRGISWLAGTLLICSLFIRVGSKFRKVPM